MDKSYPDFLPEEVTATDLSGWRDILPTRPRILAANLFADMFLADAEGAVHMLEVAAGSITQIATSEAEFHQRCAADADGWLLRPLVNQCRSQGMIPTATQCYAFTTLPLFGGLYRADNIWLSSWNEWISYTASIYAQTKALPDGVSVSIKVVD